MRKRVLYLIKTYLVIVLIFLVAKPIFMAFNSQGHPFSPSDVLQVLAHGLTLDLSTSLYFLLIPYLLVLLSVWWPKWGIIGSFLTLYNFIVALIIGLALVADLSLYPFWGFKLDASCLEYALSPDAILSSVSWGFLILRLLLLIISVALIFIFLMLQVPKTIESHRNRRRIVAASEYKSNPLSPLARIVSTVVALILIGPIIIGLRGGINESTTNVGQVYYSQNQFLNHSAVNPVFSFLSSLEKSVRANDSFSYFSQDQLSEILQGAYPAWDLYMDNCLLSHEDSANIALFRDSLLTTSRPNILIILLESCGTIFTSDGIRSDIMPRLNALMNEGIYFSSCVANSWRTDRGTLSTLSGYPSFPKTSVMKMPSKTKGLPSIAKTLRLQGYSTSYIYGGDINFTNMRSYLVATGWQYLTSMDQFSPSQQHSAKWGVRDDITFSAVLDSIANKPSEGQWLMGFSTLSSHEPWDVPISVLDDKKFNAFQYLDQCIGTLIDSLRQSPSWNDLLIVLIPDHSINYDSIEQGNPLRNLIPIIWTGGAVTKPCRIETICNQSDLAATLLAQMDLPHDDFLFSRNVLSPSYKYPFAINVSSSGFELRDSADYILYDTDGSQLLLGQSARSDSLITLGKAIFQATSANLQSLR